MRRTFYYSLISLALVATLMLSGCISPPRKVEVPNLIDLHSSSAIDLLQSKSLNPDALLGDAAPEESLESIVYFQAPDPGTRVKKNSIVSFIFYDEHQASNGGHQTDRVYKLLYVCPWELRWFEWLDDIKTLGFNAVHFYDILQWEQEGWWDGALHKEENLRQIRAMLQALKDRDMYGVLQMPTQDTNLRLTAGLMAEFDNAICMTVEEPDLHTPPQPSLAEQQRYYDTIQEVAPNLQIWGCFDGGISEDTCNIGAFHVIVTDSYGYDAGSNPVPGTLAAESGDVSLPWWTMNEWVVNVKIPRMLETIPKGVGIINLQQGMYATSEGHKLPNMLEEWHLYSEAFDGLNSFGVYAHGAAQDIHATWIMEDNRDDVWSLKHQAREVMRKLDEN